MPAVSQCYKINELLLMVIVVLLSCSDVFRMLCAYIYVYLGSCCTIVLSECDNVTFMISIAGSWFLGSQRADHSGHRRRHSLRHTCRNPAC